MTQVAELEKTLKSKSAKSKKQLDEVEQREIELMQAEKLEVARLFSLATHVGGSFPLSSLFISLAAFLFPPWKLNLCLSLCRNLRCCSSTRKHL